MANDPTPDEMRQMVEKQGAEKIPIQLITGNLPMNLAPYAIAWLAELDAAERLRNADFQASQTQTASSTKLAAWVAAVAAIVGVIITIVAWMHPIH
jgi:hypothetical protein